MWHPCHPYLPSAVRSSYDWRMSAGCAGLGDFYASCRRAQRWLSAAVAIKSPCGAVVSNAPSRWMVKEMRRNPRGRVVLVTGASRGIGRRTAERLAKLGARLALTARSAEDLAKVAGECRAAGAEAEAFPGDLTKPEDRERIVAATVARFGGARRARELRRGVQLRRVRDFDRRDRAAGDGSELLRPGRDDPRRASRT